MVGLRMTTRRMAARPRRPVAPSGGAGINEGQDTKDTGRTRGFTLVELLVVIVVLAILMALLLPAIVGALRTARQAAVSSEINAMAQALAQFNSQFGGYPPSRVILMENGNYATLINSTTIPVAQFNPNTPGWAPSGGTGDITVGQLATRTIQAFRRFWPKVQLSTSGVPPNIANSAANGTYTYYYDFNGNGVCDQNAYILQGHECLVFFLGGIPLANPLTYSDPGSVTFGMTGFGSDPTNPFSNSVVGSSMYNTNRASPLYQFNPGRLFLDPSNITNGGVSPGIPGYYDTLNNGPPIGVGTGSSTISFFAYFSAYGNGNYDPNDVNFYESDQNLQGPISLQYYVSFPTTAGTVAAGNGMAYLAVSPSPNPYTSTATAGTQSGTVTYQSPQTFQIISSGVDGLYGVGGQYVAPSQSATVDLPLDPAHTTNTSDANIRRREFDNLTNFKSGTLQ
jgi:prepilin-type N-terminal cleavage/methylation domain-containing protein